MSKKNILVFPCGSEVALEIYRSLEYSTHFNLIGGSSINDHGKFVFENYIGNIPFVTDKNFIDAIKQVVVDHNIDAIYPAMDKVIAILKENEEKIGCKIISSNSETTAICMSKTKTYTILLDHVNVPKIYNELKNISEYPVFIKPDIGYGSRGVLKAENQDEVEYHLKKHADSIVLEYLPGKEFTVDCFTNFSGELLFAGPRERNRISNGISVNTQTMLQKNKFRLIAEKINSRIDFNGAWFFQVKENKDGELVLMEIASRLGGSSGVYRTKGINFAMLSVFNSFEVPVSIIENNFEVEMDRALGNKYKINYNFKHVYIDLDDTLIVDGKVNSKLMAEIFNFVNENKEIHLITKHRHDLNETLSKYRISNIFDSIIHLKSNEDKTNFMNHKDAIFIDDSFSERKNVFEKLKIPVFGLDFNK